MVRKEMDRYRTSYLQLRRAKSLYKNKLNAEKFLNGLKKDVVTLACFFLSSMSAQRTCSKMFTNQ
jgi:hypothetical protein